MSDDLHRQLRTRLSGLAAAGVDWLPRVEAPASVPAEAAAPIVEPVAADSTERRVVELKLLADRVRGCDRCPELVATRTQTVFGVGPIGAELLFLGEAPGRTKIGKASRSWVPPDKCSIG